MKIEEYKYKGGKIKLTPVANGCQWTIFNEFASKNMVSGISINKSTAKKYAEQLLSEIKGKPYQTRPQSGSRGPSKPPKQFMTAPVVIEDLKCENCHKLTPHRIVTLQDHKKYTCELCKASYETKYTPEPKPVAKKSNVYTMGGFEVLTPEPLQVNVAWPCPEACRFPVGPQRSKHIEHCPECKRRLEELHKKVYVHRKPPSD